MKEIKYDELNIDGLISEYTIYKDEDDDSMHNLKECLLGLSLPDLRFLLVYVELGMNLTLSAKYFNTTTYFVKKRLNEIREYIKNNVNHI